MANVSGLPFYLGAFAHDHGRFLRHQNYLGRKLSLLQVSPTRGTWTTILDPWWLKRPAGFEGILDVCVPLWQPATGLDAAATGADNARWEQLGKMIHDAFPGSTVRPGWEMNFTLWDWTATPGNVEKWKSAFRHAATSLRKGGPSLKIEWCVNAGRGDSLPNAEDCYPGDGYVDLVGIDSYDWDPPYTSEANWAFHRDSYGEWQHWISFARAHGKKLMVSEFGLANKPGASNQGHDNPKYFNYLMPFLLKNADVLFGISYFDESDEYMSNSIGDGQVPNGAAEYKRQLNLMAAALGGSQPPTPTPVPSTAPAPVSAKPTGSDAITVYWTGTSGTVTVKRDGTDLEGTGPWTSYPTGLNHTFRRLRPGVTYTFTVTWNGKTATTTASIPAPVTPPATSNEVNGVKATYVSAGSVRVEWTGYADTVSRDGVDADGDGPWTDSAVGLQSYTFSNLKPNTEYSFTVTRKPTTVKLTTQA